MPKFLITRKHYLQLHRVRSLTSMLLCLAVLVTPQLCAALNDGPVALYRLDGNANDSSGNGYHGTVHNATPTVDRFGKDSCAFHFDGVSSYMTMPHLTALDPTNNHTVAAWVYLQTEATAQGMVVWYGDPQNARDPSVLNVTERRAQFRSDLAEGDLVATAESQSLLPANQWLFLAGVKEVSAGTNHLRIYVNGALAGTNSFESQLNYDTSAMNMAIGGVDWGYSGSHLFSGDIDDVRVYTRALSSAEIKDLYDSDLNVGLVAYYPLDGDLEDHSPYRNHGVPVGSSRYTDHIPVGRAGQFLPADSWYVEVPHQSQLVLSNSFSVHFWYQFAEPQRGARILQKHVPNDHNYGNTWDIAHDPDDTINFYYCWPGSAENSQAVCPLTLNTGKWYHVVFTYSLPENRFKAYLDGAFVASEIATRHSVVPLDTSLSLLMMHDRAGWPTGGALDEVRIYNRELSPYEVKGLFTLAKPAMLTLKKTIRLECFNLIVGNSFQLESSPDLNTWTNVGNPFQATNSSVIVDNYEVSDWSAFWRLRWLP